MFSFIYGCCYSLGHAIGYGAFEGLVLYVAAIMLGITTVINKKVEK